MQINNPTLPAVEEDDIVYFENGRGGVAISWDGGENVMVVTGRMISTHTSAWEESSDDLFDQLNDRQREALEAAKVETIPLLKQEARDLGRRLRATDRSGVFAPREAPIHPRLAESARVVMSEID